MDNDADVPSSPKSDVTDDFVEEQLESSSPAAKTINYKANPRRSSRLIHENHSEVNLRRLRSRSQVFEQRMELEDEDEADIFRPESVRTMRSKKTNGEIRMDTSKSSRHIEEITNRVSKGNIADRTRSARKSSTWAVEKTTPEKMKKRMENVKKSRDISPEPVKRSRTRSRNSKVHNGDLSPEPVTRLSTRSRNPKTKNIELKYAENLPLVSLSITLEKVDGRWSNKTPIKSDDGGYISEKKSIHDTPKSSVKKKSSRKSLLPILDKENKIPSEKVSTDELNPNQTPLRRSTRISHSQISTLTRSQIDFSDSEDDFNSTCESESTHESDSPSSVDSDEEITRWNRKTPQRKQSRRFLSALETPKKSYTPKTNVKTLTPNLPRRSNALSTPTTPKDRAMVALHISKVPESLPCRQNEYETIYNFLSKKIKSVDGGFMYIYGIPGAGKTATVERIIKRLQLESNTKKMKKFTFVEINGMHMTRPKDAYCHIWKKLENNVVSATMAKRLLEEKFKSSFSNKPLVLLIDEFDMLFDRTLSVVDTILDWIDQSKLVVIAIANSKDLIEEISKSSTKSRMFRERLCDVQFKTYTFDQLQEIIQDRLKNIDVFKKDAVQLLARKSAISGDVRLALNLCRRVLAEAGERVSVKALGALEVNDLLTKIYSDPRIDFILSLSRQEQTLLRAIRDVILNTGLPTCSLAQRVYDQYKTICILDDLDVKDEFSLIRMLRLLENYAFISLSDTPCTIHTGISLGNNLDLIQMAFTRKIRE